MVVTAKQFCAAVFIILSAAAQALTPEDVLLLFSSPWDAQGWAYDLKDSEGHGMDAMHILQALDPSAWAGAHYFALYHSNINRAGNREYEVRLATSNDLLHWEFVRTLIPNADMPFLKRPDAAAVPAGGAAENWLVVAHEQWMTAGSQVPSQIGFKLYASETDLASGVELASYVAPLSAGVMRQIEGTPSFLSVKLRSDGDNSFQVDADVGFHFHDWTQVDQVGFGVLRGFGPSLGSLPSFSGARSDAYNDLFINQGAIGNIGQRQSGVLGNVRIVAQEANIGPMPPTVWADWRVWLYFYEPCEATVPVGVGDAVMLEVVTHKGSKAFGNPSWTEVTCPDPVPELRYDDGSLPPDGKTCLSGQTCDADGTFYCCEADFSAHCSGSHACASNSGLLGCACEAGNLTIVDTWPEGARCLVVSYFLFSQGAQAGEGGPLLFFKVLPEETKEEEEEVAKCSSVTALMAGSVERRTNCNPLRDQKVEFLDRHRVQCGVNEAINSFRVAKDSCTGNDMRYVYSCLTISSLRDVADRESGCTELRSKTLENLDRQIVTCGDGEVLQSFQMTAGSCTGDDMSYAYSCAAVGTDIGLGIPITSDTPCTQIGGEHAHFLDRQAPTCDKAQAMLSFRVVKDGCAESSDGDFRYQITCAAIKTKGTFSSASPSPFLRLNLSPSPSPSPSPIPSPSPSLSSSQSPSSNGGVSSCTQVRHEHMIKSGLECETWSRLDKNCNLKPYWRDKKFCQQACFDIGLGYDGDDCSNDSPSPSPSPSAADVSSIVELIEAQVAKLEAKIKFMSEEMDQFKELLGTLGELCNT